VSRRWHVLVAEDERGLLELLAYNLEKEGMEVTVCEDGESAADAVRSRRPDLALLDWMLPKRSGIDVCREIRANPATADCPVIVVTARGEVHDRVTALDNGADDCLVKPFAMSELISRMRAVLRRVELPESARPLEIGGVMLDVQARSARQAGRPVHLGPKEFGILECLMRQPRRVFSREELLEAVWGRNAFIDPRTVDVNVNRLRRALGTERGTGIIRTVRLGGYAFRPAEKEGAQEKA